LSGWLRVENDGELSVDEAASHQLARTPGRFQLARAAPDLLLAVRLPEGEAQVQIGRIAFCGDLDGMPFADVVMMLAQGRRSGLLDVITGNAHRSLVFAAGDVVAASSNQNGERLGEVALQLGLIAREDLAALLSGPAAGRRVGQRLVDRGLLDREGLARALREQITRVFEAILVRPVGTFFFRDHPVAPEAAEVSVGAQALLLDGLRRLDEWTHYRTRIPSMQAVVRLGPNAPPPGDERARAVVERLQAGPATAAELAAGLRAPEMEVLRTLFHLAEANAVLVQSDRAPRPLTELGSDPGPLREMLRAFNRIFGEIFTEVAVAGKSAVFAEQAREALAEAGSEAVLRGLSFYPDGSLPVGEILLRLPEAAQAQGKGPRATLLEALQPVVAALLQRAEAHLDPQSRDDLHARLRLLFGMSAW